MIQEIRIKNFLSFRDEVVLSFEAAKDRTFEECQVVSVAPNVRLLRFALVYGANASGKTNLLSAIDFLRDFWFDKKTDIDENTGVAPFLLDAETPEAPSEFCMKFFVGDKKYRYVLVLDRKLVHKEELFVYNTVEPSLVFGRKLDGTTSSIKLNASLVKANPTIVEQLNAKCLSNMSFFAARNQVNCSLAYIDDVRDWMRKSVMPIINPDTRMFEYAGKKIEEDAELKAHILDFVHKADYNITDLYTERERIAIPDFVRATIMEAADIPEKAKEKMLAEVAFKLHTDFQHTVKNKRGMENYRLSNRLQSSGTKRTIGVETAIYEALKTNGVLPIDEIESSLHPELVEFILERFLGERNSRSQLIVTSHYDPLLNTTDDLIRKDSVWFTEKGEDGHTSLYSLIDFKGLSSISSFQKSYRNGVFGALPNIHV